MFAVAMVVVAAVVSAAVASAASRIIMVSPYRVGLAFNSFDRRPWAIAVSFCLELLH